MADDVQILVSAVDEASDVFNQLAGTVSSAAEEISSEVDEASSTFETMDTEAEAMSETMDTVAEAVDGAGSSMESINSSGMEEAADGADDLASSAGAAAEEVSGMSDAMGIINGSMMMGAAEQLKGLGDQAENMSQEMNTAAITVGQLATATGIAEPQMVSLINYISNATFPNNEAMAYVGALNQMGVSGEKLADAATNMDKINDATGIGYQSVMQLTQGLQSVGVSADQLPSAFNAIAYAQSNVTGGAATVNQVLKRQADTINEYGLNVDQLVLIMQKLSERGVQGMKMGSALSEVLKENNGDLGAIEQSLGMAAGSLENASAATGKYEGQLQKMANEEAEHKTIVDQLGAAWEDASLLLSGILSPMGSFLGMIGSAGSFAVGINGITTLAGSMRELTLVQSLVNSLNIAGTGAALSAAMAEGGLSAAFGVLTGAATAAAGAIWAAISPLLPFIAIGAAVILIIYEVGKAFGWWTDIGSMMDAISAGLQRLWNAFINHPDVQAVLSAMADAWNVIVGAIGGVLSAVADFFGISTSGEFDIVRALIDGIGFAFAAITAPIRMVIAVISSLMNTFNLLASGQITLQQAIVMVWTTLNVFWRTILNRLFSILSSTFGKMVSSARAKIQQMANAVVNNIKSLPSRVLSQLLHVARSITTAGGKWVSAAKNEAGKVVTGIYNGLKDAPSKAASALSGIVNKITKPFSDALTKVKNLVGQISNQSAKVNQHGAGGDPLDELMSGALAAGGDTETAVDLITNNEFDVQTGAYVIEEQDVNLNVDEHITLDLKNVPASISEEELMLWLRNAIGDKGLIRVLVENNDFQSLDMKVKEQLMKKAARRS